MNWHGIEYEIKNIPELDAGFVPMYPVLAAHQKNAVRPVGISVQPDENTVYTHIMNVRGGSELLPGDAQLVERMVKYLLWMKGGHRITVYGDDALARHLQEAYAGARKFDADFMSSIYERPFEIRALPLKEMPQPRGNAINIGGNLQGCRIGFDAGGSDMKVSAVIDGDVLFSEEVVWHPKVHDDPQYHYGEIVKALKKAAEHLPRVDALGVSSAGIYKNNRCMVASLFIKVPKAQFDAQVKDIYIRAAQELGVADRLVVVNDGDVAALSGALGMGHNNILGIAMGTAQAGGYIDSEGNIKGWLNELAFMPVDLQQNAAYDEWAGDIGCGVKYFSQDAVIRLAPIAGIPLDEAMTPAEKLSDVQRLMKAGDGRAAKVFRSIGVYLGHSVALYHHFYGMERVLMMGRVMSYEGGGVILDAARSVLREEYAHLDVEVLLPDEKTRRIGQSVAAASLP